MLTTLCACSGLNVATNRFVGQRTRPVAMCDLDPNSPAYRAKVAAEYDALKAVRRQQASELDWSETEVAALTEASKSLGPCWTGKLEDCPKELISKFSRKPLDFFGVLRNPTEDPLPEVWIGVRDKWPVLSEKSDEDLLAALQPIKDVYVDKRDL